VGGDTPDRTGADGTEPTGDAMSSAPPRGQSLIRCSWIGTAAFLAATGAALVTGAGQAVLIAVSVILFLAGAAAFAAAYLIAIGRSRYDAIGMGGLFFLAGTAPRSVQGHLLGSFAVELVVALAAASVGLAMAPGDAANPLAFGILAPLYGLGIAGLWGARYGTFAPRRSAGAGGDRPSAGVAGDVEGSG
jgi:hypothetical protein